MTFLPRLGPQLGAAERGAASALPERHEGHPAPAPAAGGGAASAAARPGTAPAADEPSFDFAGLGTRAGRDAGEEAGEDVTSDESGAPLRGEAGGSLALRLTDGSSVGGAHRREPSFAAELAKNVATASRVADKASVDMAPGLQPAAQAEPAHAEAPPARPRPIALRSPEPAREGDELVDVAVAPASSTLAESGWAPAAPRALGASPGPFAASSLVTPSARPGWTATATADTNAQIEPVELAKAKAGATGSAREMDSDRPARPPVASDGGDVLAFQMISQADEPPSHMSKRFEVRAVVADRLAQAEVVDHPAAGTIVLGGGGGASRPAAPVTTGRAAPTYDPNLADRSSPLPPVTHVDSLSSESLIRHGLSGQESPQSRGHIPSAAAPREPTPTHEVVPLRGAEEVASVVKTSSSRAGGVAPRTPVIVARPERSRPGPVVLEAGGWPAMRAVPSASVTEGESLERRVPGFPVAFARAGAVYARAASAASAGVTSPTPSPSVNAVPELPRSAPPPGAFPSARRGIAVRHSAVTSLATPTGGRAVPSSPATVETPTPMPAPAFAAPEHDIPRSAVTTAAAPFFPRRGADPRSSVSSGEVRSPGAVSRAVPGSLPAPAVGYGPWLESDRAETSVAGTDSGSPSDAPPVRPASERIRPAGEPSQASQPDGDHASIVAGELAVTAPPVAAPNPPANRARPPVAGGEVAAPRSSSLTDADPLAPLPPVSSRVPPRVDVALEVGTTPEHSQRLSTPARTSVASRPDEPQRGSSLLAPAISQAAARRISTPALEPPVVARQLVSGPFTAQASRRDGDGTQLVPGDSAVTAPPVAARKPRADLSRPPVAGGDDIAPIAVALTDAEPLPPLPAMSSRVPLRVDVAVEVGATPQRSARFSMPASAGLAPRADLSQRGSAQPAPAVFQAAASPVPQPAAEPPVVAAQLVSGSLAPHAFASAPHAAPHAPGAGAVAEATAAHPTPLVVSSSATPPESRLSDTRRVRAAHLDLAQQSSRSGTVATSPSTKVVGTPAPADKGEFAISAARRAAVDFAVLPAVSGLVDKLAARSEPEPAHDERPSAPGARPVRAQPGATANASVPTSAATPPAFAPAFASAAPSARGLIATGGASAGGAGAPREVQPATTAKSAMRTSTSADLAEGGPSSGSPAARADEPRPERPEATPIVVSPPPPAQAHAVAPGGHSAPGALPAPATIPPSLLPAPTAPARPLYDMATSDQSLQATALGSNAHVHLDTGAAGALSLHLSVRDGVADLEIDGPAAEALDLRPEDIRRALAGEGLSLGHFASRVNEAVEAPASRAPSTEAPASTTASEARRPGASEAAPSIPPAGFASHQSGASSYGEGRKHWHDDGADTGGRDGRSPASSSSSQSSSTSTSGDDGPRRRRGFHVTA